jgi:DNA primase
MKKEGLDFGEALRLLAQRAGVTIPSKFEREGRKEENEALYQLNDAAAQYYHNFLLNSAAAEKARNYVSSRGFSSKTVSDFQLGFSPDSWESLKTYLMERDYTESTLTAAGLIIESEDGRTHDRFRNRLMFPIHDARGHTIGFGARALDDSPPKYLNSPQTPIFDKSGILYAIDLAAPEIRRQDMIIIVEGYIDVITAHQNSITNAVASMGTAVTEKQVDILKKLSKNLFLALDSDAAGEEAMLRGVSYENTLGTEIKVVILPEGKDPDDVIKEDIGLWHQLIAEAIPIIDYTFNMVTSKLDLTTAGGKSLAAERLMPTIAEMKDAVRQAHYLQKLARTVGVDVRTLEAMLNRAAASPAKRRLPDKKQEVAIRTLRSVTSDPIEEHTLALLLRHPELKESPEAIQPEYFQNSVNREIFMAWQKASDPASLKESLDTAIHEHLDSLINKDLPHTGIEERYTSYLLRLRERYLKNMEARRAEIFANEAESGGAGADLAKLDEQGIESSIQLREIFIQKSRQRPELRR